MDDHPAAVREGSELLRTLCDEFRGASALGLRRIEVEVIDDEGRGQIDRTVVKRKLLRNRRHDRVDDLRVGHRNDAARPDLDRLNGADRRAGSHGGEIRGHEEDGPRTPCMRPDRPDPTENGHIARVVEHLRKRDGFCKSPARRIEPDHEG